MKEIEGKLHYTWENYNKDIKEICLLLKEKSKNKKIHLVSIYRGSLIMGTHLSNLFDNAPLTITKFQSYEGKNDKDLEMMYNAGIKDGEYIVLLDDILDSGNTLEKAFKYFKAYHPFNEIFSCTLIGKKTDLNNFSVRPHDGSWIVFPWEQI